MPAAWRGGARQQVVAKLSGDQGGEDGKCLFNLLLEFLLPNALDFQLLRISILEIVSRPASDLAF